MLSRTVLRVGERLSARAGTYSSRFYTAPSAAAIFTAKINQLEQMMEEVSVAPLDRQNRASSVEVLNFAIKLHEEQFNNKDVVTRTLALCHQVEDIRTDLSKDVARITSDLEAMIEENIKSTP